ncbi:MAG: type III PLP-dependent enzyme [Gammaproteobacteria bacterium]|jgi:ornithine decarboxylase|nr:type III PLP-dependent enzyme [Gammaproteobacteria bacterium]
MEASSGKFVSVNQMLTEMTPSYPVYCLRPDLIAKSADQFIQDFPGKTMFAVKCNPHPTVLKMLYKAGISHFDVASLQEISQISELFPDAALYYMHPVKPQAHIDSAHDVYHVRHYVIDHFNELYKLQRQIDTTGTTIIVRVATPDSGASYNLSEKFGATPEEAIALLQSIRDQGMETGLAFHVGSQCTTVASFKDALHFVKTILDTAQVDIKYLDIGGGFPASYDGVEIPPLQDYFDIIEEGVKSLNLPDDCELMCEPGRALVANGCSLIVQVQLRKENRLYINDGIYGSFSEAHTVGFRFPVRLHRPQGAISEKMDDFTIFGPTCDSMDVLPYTFSLPDDIREGDWIEISQLGAYSNACVTRFNGFYPETFVEISDNINH